MLKNLFEYKRWANAELLALAAKSQDALPADDWRTFLRVVNHTYVVDRIFAGHLTSARHGFASTNTEATPSVRQLQASTGESDEWYLGYVAGLNDGLLHEVIFFRFTDGDAGRMSRLEMLHHLVVHGAYHRGAAGRILAAHGITPPRDSLSVFWHQHEPTRRQPAD